MRWRKFASLLMVVLLVSPSLALVAGETSLTIETDADRYSPGEKVEISGTAKNGTNVYIKIVHNGTLENVYEYNTTVDEDGKYETTYQLSEVIEGTYLVTSLSEEEQSETLFIVETDSEEEEPDEPETPDDNGTDPVSEITDLENASLTMEIDELEDGQSLGDAIERTRIYLGKLSEMIETLDNEYPESMLNEIKTYLDDALGFIKAAETAYGKESFSEAARNHAAARNIIGRVKGLQQSIFKEHKKTRMTQFAEQITHRLQSLEDKILRINERLANGETVLASLNTAKGKLDKIQKNIQEGNETDVMEDLNDVVEGIEDDIDELNGNETSAMFNAMIKLEARIRILNSTARRLERKGYNTTEIQQQIDADEGLLGQMMGHLESGISEGDMFSSVDDQISIGELLRKYRRTNENGQGPSKNGN
jgi:hypothetical protein